VEERDHFCTHLFDEPVRCVERSTVGHLDLGDAVVGDFEVCRRLRRDAQTAGIAVVFHTAQGSVPGARHEGDAFLTYPVAMDEVYSTIRSSIERRRSRMGRIIE
jgi:DNA-binding response OmpR family regulator